MKKQTRKSIETITARCRNCGKILVGIGRKHLIIISMRHLYECSPEFRERVSTITEEYLEKLSVATYSQP